MVDYQFPTKPNLVYTELYQVPNHIKKQVLIDSLNLPSSINIYKDKDWIKLETDSNEAQLFLCNLRNRDGEGAQPTIIILLKIIIQKY